MRQLEGLKIHWPMIVSIDNTKGNQNTTYSTEEVRKKWNNMKVILKLFQRGLQHIATRLDVLKMQWIKYMGKQ